METENFIVKTEQFEGPLDLLLQLIEKRKLHINDISLAQVTDDFINQVKKLEHFPLSQIANFVLTAATLLLIKSKSLLPGLELSTEEQGDIAELENRLKEYRRLKELSRQVGKLFGRQVIFAGSARQFEPVFAPSAEITAANLEAGLRRIINDFPLPPKLPVAIVKKIISLEEVIADLLGRIKTALQLNFKELVGGGRRKENIIVNFLAILELTKRGIIAVRQESRFGEIEITANG